MNETKTNTAMLKDAVAKELAFMKLPTGESKRISSLYRHNVHRQLGENPELYGRILQILPSGLHHNSAEESAYAVLTLAAFVGNHGAGNLAEAIAEIEYNENIVKRFRKVEMAKNMNELLYYLRGVLKLIASAKKTVDYVALAGDLYRWQYLKIDQVRRWERSLVKW